MSKILLTGPAGAGKTAALLDDFEKHLRAAEDPLSADYFFILPSAEHTERITSLIVQRGVRGFFHRRVTTLSRLVSENFGMGDDGIASNVTRYLMLRDIFTEKRWDCFADVQDNPGFLSLMLSFISELKDSLITASEFRERMNHLKKIEPDLNTKYEALAQIYEYYQAGLEGRGLRDRADNLGLYRRKKKEGLFRGVRFKKIWLDGFFDFSELQLAYLAEICALSDEVVVTLTLEESPHRFDLFEAVLRTQEKLVRLGFEKKKVAVNAAGKLPAVMQAAERLFSTAVQRKKLEPPEEIRVLEAIGMEGEIEMIAQTILRTRQSEDIRFSDFAVLLRNIGEYEGVIRAVFSRYAIPVEIHERERLAFSGLIQVVVCLLRIFRDGWVRADVLQFLKSSYVKTLGAEPKNYECIAWLEHEAMAKGVFRSREAWLADWENDRKSDQAQRKTGILAALADVEDALRSAACFSDLKKGLLDAVLHTFSIYSEKSDDADSARYDGAVFRRLLALLDEIEISFNAAGLQKECSFEQFAERFFRLVDLDLFSVHDKDKNKVQIYNVSLARQKDYEVVFVAGLLEKKFPVQIKEDPVFSDWERRLFNGRHERALLKERLPSQAMEKFLFYLAITRARRKLYLTYPRLDLEGKESLPSFYVNEMDTLYAEPLKRKSQGLAHPYPEPEEAVNKREFEMGLVGRLWDPANAAVSADPLLKSFVWAALQDPAARKRLMSTFYEVKAELKDKAIRETQAFRALSTSSSRLEEYAKCAFKYYANYVLKLNDPEDDRNAATRGTILHFALEHFFRQWVKDPKLRQSNEKSSALAMEKLEEGIRLYPLLVERRYQVDLEHESLRDTLKAFLNVELDRLKAARLQPRFFEYNFGGRDADSPPFELKDEKGKIEIQGKIDRIDTDDSGRAALVLDYKTNAVFRRRDLEFGTFLQLPIYTMAVESLLGVEVAGAELYSVKGVTRNGFYLKEKEQFFPKMSWQRMVLERGEFNALMNLSKKFIRKFASEMESALIPVKPRECVSYCSYASVCRIEKWRLPSMARDHRLEDVKEGRVLSGEKSGQREKKAYAKR